MTQKESFTILVVDDDRSTRRLIEVICRKQPYRLIFAENGRKALDCLTEKKERLDLVLSDVMMPLMGGEDLLAAVKKQAPHLPVVLMTSYGSIDSAVRFLRAGAKDYITKPLHKEVLLHRIQTVLGANQLAAEVGQLKKELDRHKGLVHIVGRSSALIGMLKKLPAIAKTDASVVVYGESGTGKELIAHAIHSMSRRSDRQIVAMNCGALPENLLETELFGYRKGAFTDATQDRDGIVKEADGGSLFLDEIGEISLKMQVKLLRFLQQKEYKPVGSSRVLHADVRFISATNRDLLAEMRKGAFREDLYYRLNIIPIRLPALRERLGDIPLLADHFLRRFAQKMEKPALQFHPDSMEKLMAYSWPGNIRELENKILQVIVMSDRELITPDLIVLPRSIEEDENRNFMTQNVGLFKEEKAQMVRRFEKNYLSTMLSLHHGNISQAANASGMDRKNFWQKMKKYGLVSRDFT